MKNMQAIILNQILRTLHFLGALQMVHKTYWKCIRFTDSLLNYCKQALSFRGCWQQMQYESYSLPSHVTKNYLLWRAGQQDARHCKAANLGLVAAADG